VRATGDVVLVDKSEAEKSNRLKTTFLEKIVPLLIEEFSYTNIHQVTLYKFSNLLIKLF
jgi:large subunit ribosomal protein L5